MSQILGYSEQELLEIKPRDLLVDESKKKFQQLMLEALSCKKTLFSDEYEVKTKKGQTIWALLHERVNCKKGIPDTIQFFAQDITERKEMESAQKLSEEKFSKAFLNSPFAVTLTSLSDGVVIDANEAATSLFGYSLEEVVGTDSLRFWADPNERPKFVSEINSKGVIKNKEIVFQKKDRGHLFVNLSGSIITIQEEKYLLSTFIDITKRKKAEEALIVSQTNLQNILDSVEDGISLVGLDGKVIDCNKASEKLLGLSREEFIGTNVYDIVVLEDRQKALNGASKVLETGKIVNCVRVLRKNNSAFDAEISVTVIYDKNRKPVSFVGVTRDITERKILENKLQEYTKNLENLVEARTKQLQNKERLAAIGQTAGMVGHDIRNPLQAIMSDTYLLKEELTSIPECKMKEGMAESIDTIEKNVNYINKIVQDLQDYARPIAPEYSEINLSNIFVNIFETVSLPASIKLSIKIKDVEKLRTDPMLLQRALTNLVINAIQAMPEGGILEINGQPKDKQILISIRDTGIGIPDYIKDKLFAPMITTKAKGQGFGLAVSKRLIEGMKGTISVKSEEGKGTKFIIKLPT